METIILIAVVLAMIGVGMRLIHLLNAQHDARIAAHHYTDVLPGVGRRGHRKQGHTS
ncbi:hypothetical protein [Streptomyces sp. NPDC051211]|uniref:hypothetical protein n=1 Tax=Streptomyces sp. NPDC051211 TaxID=3154643 RepID=UPI00344BB9DD